MSVLTRRTILALSIALTSAAIAPAAHANVMVDDFTQSVAADWLSIQNTSTAGNSPVIETGLSTIPGGTREYILHSATMSIPGLDSITTNVFHQSGVSLFDYQSSSGAASDFSLIYGDEFTNPLHLIGATGIAITFTGYDRVAAGPLEVDIAFAQQTSPNTAVTNSQTLQMLASGAKTIVFPDVGPLLTSIDQISFDFIAPAGTDFRIDSISLITTPEPASIGLLALAAPLLLKRRR